MGILRDNAVQYFTLSAFGLQVMAYPTSSSSTTPSLSPSTPLISPVPCTTSSFPTGMPSSQTHWDDWPLESTSAPTDSPTSTIASSSSTLSCASGGSTIVAHDAGNLIGIPQAGDVIFLSEDVAVTPQDSSDLAAHVESVLAASGLNGNQSAVGQLLERAVEDFTHDDRVPTFGPSDVNDLLEGCWEDEACLFYNSTTAQVLDIFSFIGDNGFSSTAGLWDGLAQSIDRVNGLGLMFSPVFASWAPAIAMIFQGSQMTVTKPGALMMYDVIR